MSHHEHPTFVTGRPKYVFFREGAIRHVGEVAPGERFTIRTQRGDPGAASRGAVFLREAGPDRTVILSIVDVRLDTEVLVTVGDCFRNRVSIRAVPGKLLPNGDLSVFDIRVPTITASVGSLGLAPFPTAATNPSVTGGNIDSGVLRPGTHMLLPCAWPGGLLALGDLHAHVPEGEFWGAAIEATGAVDILFHGAACRPVLGPILVTPEAIAAVGHARKYPEAAVVALETLASFLHGWWSVPEKVATFLVGSFADLRNGAIWPLIDGIRAEERLSVYAVLSKKVLSRYGPPIELVEIQMRLHP